MLQLLIGEEKLFYNDLLFVEHFKPLAVNVALNCVVYSQVVRVLLFIFLVLKLQVEGAWQILGKLKDEWDAVLALPHWLFTLECICAHRLVKK